MFRNPGTKDSQWDPRKYFPVVSGQILLAEEKHKALLPELVPFAESEDQFQTIYTPLIQNFAEHVQHLPQMSKKRYAFAGGMLQHGLERAFTATQSYLEYLDFAKIRTTPPSRQQALWTYVVFSAALLRDVGQTVSQFHVELSDANRKFQTVWLPYDGPMTHFGQNYTCDILSDVDNTDIDWITPLLARQLMPKSGLQWIANDRDVMRIWLILLNGKEASAFTGRGIMPRLIPWSEEQLEQLGLEGLVTTSSFLQKLGDKKATQFFLSYGHDQKGTGSQAQQLAAMGGFLQQKGKHGHGATSGKSYEFSDAAAAFLQWTRDQLKSAESGKIPGDSMHKVKEGLLITEKAWQQFKDAAKGNPNINHLIGKETWKQVAKQLMAMGLAVANAKGQMNHHYQTKQAETKKGILIRDLNRVFPILPTRIVQALQSHQQNFKAAAPPRSNGSSSPQQHATPTLAAFKTNPFRD